MKASRGSYRSTSQMLGVNEDWSSYIPSQGMHDIRLIDRCTSIQERTRFPNFDLISSDRSDHTRTQSMQTQSRCAKRSLLDSTESDFNVRNIE